MKQRKAITPKGRKTHLLADEQTTLCGCRVQGPCWPYVVGDACRNCLRVAAARAKARSAICPK